MRRTRLKRRKGKFSGMVIEFNILVFAAISFIFALGTVAGIFMLNGVSDAEFERLLSIWGVAAGENYKDGFLESFFKYGAVIFGIWLCGFFKFGIIGTAVLIFLKGSSIGFTSAFIIKCMGTDGFFLIFRLCFFRDFFIIFLCFAAGILAVRKYVTGREFKGIWNYYTSGAALFIGLLAVCVFF